MLKIIALIIAVFVTGLSCEVYSQDAGARAQTLAAALDKNKYKKKEKHNIKIEIYIDIKNERPRKAIRPSIRALTAAMTTGISWT